LSFKYPSRCSRSLSGVSTAARLLGLGIRIRSGHGCLSLVCVVFCQVSATGRSLSQRYPPEEPQRGGLGLLELSSHEKKSLLNISPVSLTKYFNPTSYLSSSPPLLLRTTANKWKNKFCKEQSISFRDKIWRCRKLVWSENYRSIMRSWELDSGLSTRDLKTNWRVWFTAFKLFFSGFVLYESYWKSWWHAV